MFDLHFLDGFFSQKKSYRERNGLINGYDDQDNDVGLNDGTDVGEADGGSTGGPGGSDGDNIQAVDVTLGLTQAQPQTAIDMSNAFGSYRGGWEAAAADKSSGYPGAGGYSVGTTGANTGDMSFGDMDGYGFGDDLAIGTDLAIGFASDHVLGLTGAVIGGAFGGFPGALTGWNIGETISDIDTMTDDEIAMALADTAVNLGAPAPIRGAYNLARAVTSPATNIRGHALSGVLGVVGTVAGGPQLGIQAAQLGHKASSTVDRAADVIGIDRSGWIGSTTNSDMMASVGPPVDAPQIGAPTDTGNLQIDKGRIAEGSTSQVWNGSDFVDPSALQGAQWNGTAFV